MNTAAGRIETFALSRCRFLAGTGQHFARPVGFHAPAFFKDALGISQADKPWKVRLLFAREVAGNRRRMGISLRNAVALTQRKGATEQRRKDSDSLARSPAGGPIRAPLSLPVSLRLCLLASLR